jgi:eukaryotic-like serine/threonine-protein kinase
MVAPKTSADLFSLITQSELVDPQQLRSYEVNLRTQDLMTDDAVECAQLMVCEGLLTQFQARLLLQGKWKNFFLGGKYKVLEQLGAGGMGSVFLCEHRYMRRRVAVKVLPPEKSQSQTMLDRFLREAQAVARLDHPNIVRAHDIGNHGGMYYLVLEYIEGVNLHQLVEEHGRLPVNRAVNYICQSAMGLEYAHRSRLIHRDVKPANLLLDQSGVVKVLDLGLARFAEDSLSDSTKKDDGDGAGLLGTADYIAPEQAIDPGLADHRSDIYSLGATLFYLLTGQPLFSGGTIAQKLIRHQTAHPTPVEALRPEVPRGIRDVVQWMLSKKPDDRPQTALKAAEALRDWYEPVGAPSPEELPAARFAVHGDIDPHRLSQASSHTMHGSPANKTMVMIRPNLPK